MVNAELETTWREKKIHLLQCEFIFSDNGASIVVLSSIQSGHNGYPGAGKLCDQAEGVYRDEETNILAPGKNISITILNIPKWIIYIDRVPSFYY